MIIEWMCTTSRSNLRGTLSASQPLSPPSGRGPGRTKVNVEKPDITAGLFRRRESLKPCIRAARSPAGRRVGLPGKRYRSPRAQSRCHTHCPISPWLPPCWLRPPRFACIRASGHSSKNDLENRRARPSAGPRAVSILSMTSPPGSNRCIFSMSEGYSTGNVIGVVPEASTTWVLDRMKPGMDLILR